ncbi:MAG: hypothetical protein RL094_754 [Candidatus Parcubacteria bacterium]|jgi:hypothetical protein
MDTKLTIILAIAIIIISAGSVFLYKSVTHTGPQDVDITENAPKWKEHDIKGTIYSIQFPSDIRVLADQNAKAIFQSVDNTYSIIVSKSPIVNGPEWKNCGNDESVDVMGKSVAIKNLCNGITARMTADLGKDFTAMVFFKDEISKTDRVEKLFKYMVSSFTQ